jgi:hypothetical protein
MQTSKHVSRTVDRTDRVRGHAWTLLDLVSAVSDEGRVTDDHLVASVVLNLLLRGQAKLSRMGGQQPWNGIGA